MVDSGPFSGATPSSPQKGASGSRIPGQNSTGPCARQVRDLQVRVGKVVRQQPEARDRGRPAPVGRDELEQVDLERVAGLGSLDGHRSGDLVDLVEDERLERGGGRVRVDLAVRRVEAVEFDDVPGADARHRLDGRVPGEVVLVSADADGGCGLRHRAPLPMRDGTFAGRMERETRIELATCSLEGCRSTN